MKHEVAERALQQRVARFVERQGQKLCGRRKTTSEFKTYGKYYIVDLKTNEVIRPSLDLAEFAHHYGVMKQWEELVRVPR